MCKESSNKNIYIAQWQAEELTASLLILTDLKLEAKILIYYKETQVGLTEIFRYTSHFIPLMLHSKPVKSSPRNDHIKTWEFPEKVEVTVHSF